MNDCFDVVFRGQVIEPFAHEKVQETLKRSMKLNNAQLQKLFSGVAVVIKKDLALEQAQTMQIQLAGIGAQTRVEPSSKRQQAASAPNKTPKAANKPALSLKPIADKKPALSLTPMADNRPAPNLSSASDVRASSAESVDSFQNMPYTPEPRHWLSRKIDLTPIKRSLSGIVYSFVGAGFLLMFPPFDGASIKRGTAMGLALFCFGVYRLMTWSKVK